GGIGGGQGVAHAGVRHSIRVHLPKMPFPPTQPLTRPRLFPIWKRFPWIAFTRCRYCLPLTLHSTMSPTWRVAGATGSTVHSWPDSILPFIEFPLGRNCTVSPFSRRETILSHSHE